MVGSRKANGLSFSSRFSSFRVSLEEKDDGRVEFLERIMESLKARGKVLKSLFGLFSQLKELSIALKLDRMERVEEAQWRIIMSGLSIECVVPMWINSER